MAKGFRAGRQSGVTAIGALVLAFLLGFWVLVVIKLLPVYMDYISVKDMLKVYQSEAHKIGTSRKNIEKKLYKLFQFNSITNIDLKKALSIKTNKKKETIVGLDYQVEVPFLTTQNYGQVLVLLKFSDHVVVNTKKKKK